MKKNWQIFLLGIGAALVYLLLNNPHGTVHNLSVAVDSKILFVPIFVFPYILFLPVFWLTYLWAFVKNENFKKFAWAMIITSAVSYLFYYFFQTNVYRLEISGSDLSSRLVQWIYSHDNPYNAFPSLHTSFSIIFSAYIIMVRPKYAWLAIIFSSLVIASTLLIKQHYIADVIAGLILGLSASIIFFRKSLEAGQTNNN